MATIIEPDEFYETFDFIHACAPDNQARRMCEARNAIDGEQWQTAAYILRNVADDESGILAEYCERLAEYCDRESII